MSRLMTAMTPLACPAGSPQNALTKWDSSAQWDWVGSWLTNSMPRYLDDGLERLLLAEVLLDVVERLAGVDQDAASVLRLPTSCLETLFA